jgi:hypothetical protein
MCGIAFPKLTRRPYLRRLPPTSQRFLRNFTVKKFLRLGICEHRRDAKRRPRSRLLSANFLAGGKKRETITATIHAYSPIFGTRDLSQKWGTHFIINIAPAIAGGAA